MRSILFMSWPERSGTWSVRFELCAFSMDTVGLEFVLVTIAIQEQTANEGRQ